MKSKYIFIILIIILANNKMSAQKNDYIWLFGYRSELPDSIIGYGGFDFDFNENPFKIRRHKREMHLSGANASICDEDGQLQAYTNECFLANKYDRRIRGGDSLYNYSRVKGGNCYLGEPVSGYSLILPDYNKANFVHLFMLVDRGLRLPIDSIDGITTFRYLLHTKINLSANQGEAEVVFKNKVVIYDSIAAYGLKACKHSNGHSWWFILKKMLSHQFIRILVTEDSVINMGVQTFQPLINYSYWGSGNGTSSFSPNGNLYAWFDPYNDLNIYDFDRSTGLLSNYRKIVINDSLLFGGLAFSPNNRYAYTTSRWDLYQIDLEALDPNQSIEHISHYSGNLCPISFTSTAYNDMQLGPDCRIYMNTPGTVTCLHVINHPDRKGKACDFVEQGIMLPARNGISLPNFPHYRIDNPYPCDSNIMTSFIDIPEDIIQCNIYPNPATDYIVILANWNQVKNPLMMIYDINGHEVKNFRLNTNLEEQKVSIIELPKGVYFYQIRSESEWLKSGKILVE